MFARDVEVREQRALLRDVTDPAGLRRQGTTGPGHHLVAEADGARLGLEEAGDQPEQGGLAAAGRAEHRRDRALRDGQVHAVDGHHGAERPGHAVEVQAAHGAILSEGAARVACRPSRIVAGIEIRTSSNA